MAFDFAIFGSSPSALLLGGLLATAHGKSVCVIGEPWSPWPLQRRLDAGLIVATRPPAWALLRAGSHETVKIINGIGKHLVDHVDPVLVAETPRTLEAITHMRAVATGSGYDMEQVADRTLAEPAAAWRLRQVPALIHGKAEPAISQWLDRSGARRWRPQDGDISIRRDGTVRIRSFGREFDANEAVLIDDAAILAWLPEAARDRLRLVAARTMLTEPTRPIAAPIVRYLDRGVTLSQRGKSGVTAIATGAADAAARIGSTLAAQAPLRRAGDIGHMQVETGDGAPLVAYGSGTRTRIVAGFGDASIFFVPALTRFLVGKASEAEASFFAAHDSGRGNARQQVADFRVEAA